MRSSNSYRRTPPLRILALALIAGMLWTNACATDAIGPDSTRALPPAGPHNVLQDENLVPNYDFANPGALEPYGSLWSSLDEDIPNDDTDYIYRFREGQPPVLSEATVDLTDPVGTPSPTQAHWLKVRWKVVGDYSTDTPEPTRLNYSLMYANTVLATKTSYPSGSDYVTDSVSVSIPQYTDYRALQIRFQLTLKPANFNQIQGRITWARLEIR